MIISHKHKFIFVKTKKTAGTSVEIALSRHLGDNDVITPIVAADEELRKKSNARAPQNYIETSLLNYNPRDWLRRWRRGVIKNRYYNHMYAELIKRRIGADIWDNYTKFSIERNPWDKVISLYHYQNMPEKNISLEEFVKSGKAAVASDFARYSINGNYAMDYMCMYENLKADLHKICEHVGIPELDLPAAKSGFRKEKKHYSKMFDESSRAIVSQTFQREIGKFGYEF